MLFPMTEKYRHGLLLLSYLLPEKSISHKCILLRVPTKSLQTGRFHVTELPSYCCPDQVPRLPVKSTPTP